MTDLTKLLIFNMKKHRERLGLSQYVLAERLGISSDMVAKIESGRRFPSAKTLDKLLSVFGIKPYQLFIGVEEPFEREKFIANVYPLITQDILNRLKQEDI